MSQCLQRLLLAMLAAQARVSRASFVWSLASAVQGVTYTDTNPAPDTLDGIVQWLPPVDVSGFDFYLVYIAYDEACRQGALLWDAGDEEEGTGPDRKVPVGVNQMIIHPSTGRATMDPALPANWLIVRAFRSEHGAVQPVELGATLPLYDTTTRVPNLINMAVSFTDADPEASQLGGTLQWAPVAGSDLGFTTHYAVYQAADPHGAAEELLQTVPRVMRALPIAHGTPLGSKRYLLVYALNPNGRSAAAASVECLDLDGPGGQSATSTTGTAITSGTTPTLTTSATATRGSSTTSTVPPTGTTSTSASVTPTVTTMTFTNTATHTTGTATNSSYTTSLTATHSTTVLTHTATRTSTRTLSTAASVTTTVSSATTTATNVPTTFSLLTTTTAAISPRTATQLFTSMLSTWPTQTVTQYSNRTLASTSQPAPATTTTQSATLTLASPLSSTSAPPLTATETFTSTVPTGSTASATPSTTRTVANSSGPTSGTTPAQPATQTQAGPLSSPLAPTRAATHTLTRMLPSSFATATLTTAPPLTNTSSSTPATPTASPATQTVASPVASILDPTLTGTNSLASPSFDPLRTPTTRAPAPTRATPANSAVLTARTPARTSLTPAWAGETASSTTMMSDVGRTSVTSIAATTSMHRTSKMSSSMGTAVVIDPATANLTAAAFSARPLLETQRASTTSVSSPLSTTALAFASSPAVVAGPGLRPAPADPLPGKEHSSQAAIAGPIFGVLIALSCASCGGGLLYLHCRNRLGRATTQQHAFLDVSAASEKNPRGNLELRGSGGGVSDDASLIAHSRRLGQAAPKSSALPARWSQGPHSRRGSTATVSPMPESGFEQSPCEDSFDTVTPVAPSCKSYEASPRAESVTGANPEARQPHQGMASAAPAVRSPTDAEPSGEEVNSTTLLVRGDAASPVQAAEPKMPVRQRLPVPGGPGLACRVATLVEESLAQDQPEIAAPKAMLPGGRAVPRHSVAHGPWRCPHQAVTMEAASVAAEDAGGAASGGAAAGPPRKASPWKGPRDMAVEQPMRLPLRIGGKPTPGLARALTPSELAEQGAAALPPVKAPPSKLPAKCRHI